MVRPISLLTKLSFLATLFAVYSVSAQVFIPYVYWSCKDFYDSETTNTSTDFTRGTFSNTNVSGNSVVLSVGQTSGTYTSRVYDIFGGCSPLQSWQKFQWKTNLPYGKEMVATSETAVDYSAITASLTTGIAAEFRLNGIVGTIASGTAVVADVGSNAKIADGGGTAIRYATGKLGQAVSMDGTNDYVDLTNYTQTAVNDYSISVWFKTAQATNGVLVQDRGSGAGNSLTLGIGNNPGGCAAGKLSYGVDSNGVYNGICSNTSYNDGAWHHVVGVWDGTAAVQVATAQFSLFVDGAAVSTTTYVAGTAPTAPLTGLGRTKFGYHEAWTAYFAGLMDETVIWTRALTATEVLNLYQRGGNNVKFQIKTCDTNTCGDVATWKGPDNTAASYFTEFNNNTVQASGAGTVLTVFPSMIYANFPPLVVNTKRFFQYQSTLTTDVSTIQPSFHTTVIHHGCAAGTVAYSTDTTFTLPKLCTIMTVTAVGAGGGAGSSQGGGNKAAAGAGGRAVKTFSGLTPLTAYQISIGQGGICAQTGGSGGTAGYDGGDGALTAAGTSGDGTLGWGGAAGAGGASGFAGALGKFGGGGGGAGNGPGGGDGSGGGGGATSLKQGATIMIVAGGGGASGGSKTGTAGTGGAACGGAVSGDYTIGSNGGAAAGNQSGGGGGGGACYCQGGCTSAAATGGSGGDNAGSSCQVSNNGGAGSISITYQ